MIELSNLDAVDLREVWPNEARDFTPWLADNIEQLSAVLGMDLELRSTEAEVGAFSLDVLAHDLGNDRPVVIENQLESTNHDHLGKLLTYAARYDAQTVVWLVRELRPEHRAALDWLNQRTGEDTAFFGVVIEAWKIGDSPPAPRFNPVAVPNDWQKQMPDRDKNADVSGKRLRYREFFQALIDTLREEHQFTRARKGQAQNWYHFTSGFNGMQYNAAFTGDGKAMAGLYISTGDKDRNEGLFDQLVEHKAAIEDKIGSLLDWDRRDDIQACFVHAVRDSRIEDDDEELEQVRKWMIDRLLAFKSAFSPHLDEILS